jgi:hypothetical protein
VSEDDGWLFESGYDVRTDEWIVRARNGSEVARVAEVVRSSSWAAQRTITLLAMDWLDKEAS